MARLEFFGLKFKTGYPDAQGDLIITKDTLKKVGVEIERIVYDVNVARENVDWIQISKDGQKIVLEFSYTNGFPDFEKDYYRFVLEVDHDSKKLLLPTNQHYSILFSCDDVIKELTYDPVGCISQKCYDIDYLNVYDIV